MKITKLIAFCATILVSLSAAAAGETMIISTGSPKGIYNPLANDLATICELNDVAVLESNGSLDNHEKIWARPPQATAGIFQYDFALYMRDRDPRWQRSMMVVARLHDEYLQIVTLNQELKQGGWSIPGTSFTIGASKKILERFSDLSGQTVYAWGGSWYSANVLSDKFGLGLNVVDLTSTAPDGAGGYRKVAQGAAPEKVAAMLIAKGEGVAIISVGGSNLGWVTKANGFDKNWKLLSVSVDNQRKVGGTYGLGKVNYLNLSGGEVETLTIPALLMSRKYSSAGRTVPLKAIQDCIRDNYDMLRDEGDSTWTVIDPKSALNFESSFPMFGVSDN